MEKLTKQELKQPDGFIQLIDRLSQMIAPLKKGLMVLGVLVLIGFAGLAFWDWYSDHKEEQAQSELFTINYQIQKHRVELDDAFKKTQESIKPKTPTVVKSDKEKAPEAATIAPRPKNLEADFGSQIKMMEDFVQKQKGTKASVLGAINLALLLKEYGEIDKSLHVLEKSAISPRKDDILSAIVQMKLGDLKETKGQCEAAITHWDNVSGQSGFSAMKPEALLRKGLCLESLNKPDKAIEVYQALTKEFAESRAGREGKKFLRVLQAKNNGQAS